MKTMAQDNGKLNIKYQISNIKFEANLESKIKNRKFQFPALVTSSYNVWISPSANPIFGTKISSVSAQRITLI